MLFTNTKYLSVSGFLEAAIGDLPLYRRAKGDLGFGYEYAYGIDRATSRRLNNSAVYFVLLSRKLVSRPQDIWRLHNEPMQCYAFGPDWYWLWSL